MSTISASTHRTASMNLFIVLAIVVVAALAFAAVSSMVAPQPSIIPVTGSLTAYVDFLQGEKEIYAESSRLPDAFSAYHLGEQTVYRVAVNSDNALTTWHLGERTIVQFNAAETALLSWREGEKHIK